MHGHLRITEFRKRGTSVASATSKFACCRMCARLQDHCDGRVSSNRLLPARKKKEKHEADKNCLSSGPRPKAHTRGHPCRECWRQAGRTRPLARHAPGACHQQGTSRLHPSLAVQAGLFRRGASFTIACLPFSPLSLRTHRHRHLHCHASTGPRCRKSERRRSESDI